MPLYLHNSNGDLLLYRATNPDGTAWNAGMAPDGGTGLFWDTSLFMFNLGGMPVIFGSNTTHDICMIRALDTDGGTWDVPDTILADDNSVTHSYTLDYCANIAGRFALLVSDSTTKELIYMRATADDASAWDAPQLVAADKSSSAARLLEVVGLPAVLFQTVDAGFVTHGPFYKRAQDVDGVAWDAAIPAGRQDVEGGLYSFILLDGNPAFIQAATGQPARELVRAQDALGSAWDPGQPLPYVGLSPSLAVLPSLGGMPAISYYSFDSDMLFYMTAQDAQGTSWNAPESASCANITLSNRLIELNGHPAVSYHSSDGGVFTGGMGIAVKFD